MSDVAPLVEGFGEDEEERKTSYIELFLVVSFALETARLRELRAEIRRA